MNKIIVIDLICMWISEIISDLNDGYKHCMVYIIRIYMLFIVIKSRLYNNSLGFMCHTCEIYRYVLYDKNNITQHINYM